MTEQEIQDEILVYLNKNYHDKLRLWRNNVGLGYGYGRVKQLLGYVSQGKLKKALSYAKKMRPIQFGVKGSPDLQGFITVGGRAVYLGIEVKDAKGKQQELQKKYEQMVDNMGGYYFLCRSLDDAIKAIKGILTYGDL